MTYAAESHFATVVGYQTISTPKNGTIGLGLQFKDTGLTEQKMKVKDLIKPNSPAQLWGRTSRDNYADQIMVWTGSDWAYYYVNSTADNVWVKDGVTPLKETEDTIGTGETVLFRRSGRGANTDTITVPGEVIQLGGTKTTGTVKNATVFMTYPWPVSMKIKDMTKYIDQTTWGRPSRDNYADQIIKWVGSDWVYYYYNSTVNAWVKDGVTPAEETEDEIAPGEGFLFRRSGRGGNTDTVTFKGPDYVAP